MSIYFSASTGGFYDSAIHGDAIPEDAVEITAERHVELLDGQSEGKRIVAGKKGKPELADPIPPTEEQLAAGVRADRDSRIAAVEWRYARHARESRLGVPATDDIAKLDAYVQALADVPSQKGFPSKVVWPELP